MTKNEIKAILDDKNIAYEDDMKKSELEALLPEESREKETRVKLTAKYKTVDDEGDRVKLALNSEGKNVIEALTNLEFPEGLNVPVNLKLERNDKELERRLAPHKAREILENKDEYEFERVFRGV